MSMRNLVFVATLLCLCAAGADLRPKQRVKVLAPDQEQQWLVADNCANARLFITNSTFRHSAVKTMKVDAGLVYGSGDSATVQYVDDDGDCVNVAVLPDGPEGWIHEDLAQLTPEEKRKVDASNAAPKSATAKAAAALEADRIERERPDPSRPLQLLDESGKYNEYFTIIVGRVRNNTRRTYSYVQILYNLYDSAGNRVGSAMTNVNNLEPGGVWKFNAVALVPAKEFKVSGINGF